MIKVKPPTVWQAVRNHMTRHVYDRMLKVINSLVHLVSILRIPFPWSVALCVKLLN